MSVHTARLVKSTSFCGVLLANLAWSGETHAEPGPATRHEGIWGRGGLGGAYLHGTQHLRVDAPAGGVRQEYSDTIDAPGVSVSLVGGYLLSPALGVGAQLDAAVFSAHLQVEDTRLTNPQTASAGLIFSLAVVEHLYTTTSFSACQFGWLSGDTTGVPRLPGRMSGPSASLGVGWFQAWVGVQGRLTYLHVFGERSEFEAMSLEFSYVAQYW